MNKNIVTSIALAVLFLISAAGVVEGATNLIKNPGFESGTTSWLFYASGTGKFTAAPPGYEGNNSAKLVLNSPGTNIQLYQTGVKLEPNTLYRLSFAANSTSGHDLTVNLFKHVSPYTNYGLSNTFDLGTSLQVFNYEFTTKGFTNNVSDGRFQFWLAPFAAAGDIYYIDAIIVEKIGDDTAPPIVIGNTPTGTNVSVNTQITVTFNESMNQSSAQTAFSTLPSTTGSFTWSGNMMIYTPGSNLSEDTTYNVTVGTGVKDLAGNNMQSSYDWNFITKSGAPDISPPIVTGSTPTGTDVPVTTQITVTFNESMNQSSAQTAFSTDPSTTGGFNWNGNMMIYTPGSNLAYNTTYTVTVGTGAKDIAGNNLQAPYSWQFTTISTDGLEIRVAELEKKMAVIEKLLSNVTRNENGSDIYIDGANLHIRDGSGDTEGLVNGLGNLIIGYNEQRGYGQDDNRTGSHNLVMGTGNNYRSYGGLVAGIWNTISGEYASVSGGNGNTASGHGSSVSGGYNNIASGEDSSVSGGGWNTASNGWDWVSGGYNNTASGGASSVSGGGWNTASVTGASVSGGYGNTANGPESSVSGGFYNIASGSHSSVSGGKSNTASDPMSSVSGGEINRAGTYASWVSGGYNNIANGQWSSVIGGYNNIASGWYSSVSGGDTNTASGERSSVSGGDQNTASGSYSSVSGGQGNIASGSWSWVGGGGFLGSIYGNAGNTASGDHSSVSGGQRNTAIGSSSSVSGGQGNSAIEEMSSISGGMSNTALGYSSSVSGGTGNNAIGAYSSVSGGERNTASGWYSSVSGGVTNTASGQYSSISGGGGLDNWGYPIGNTASGSYSSVSGGVSNIASGDSSSVSGGLNRNATGIYDWVAGGLLQEQ